MADGREAAPAADPLQEQMDAAENLARLMSGDDDQRFILVFHALVNLMDGFLSRPGEQGVQQARSTLLRTAEPHVIAGRRGLRATGAAPGLEAGSVLRDPVFIDNAKKLIPDRTRIVGGVLTADFPDCVAVGTDDLWCCTGTLVAPNVVVTAGHCVRGGCATRVFLGQDVDDPDAGKVVQVEEAQAHPDYRPPNPTHDLSVLILDEDATVAPRAIAADGMLAAAATVRLAGFGNTDVFSSGGYGRRRMVDVPLASNDPVFGADSETEFVAGAPFLDRDSCNGDSGGPAYLQSEDSWYLAGATSRATARTIRPCGDGGIYTRVKSFEDWVRSVPGGHWD